MHASDIISFAKKWALNIGHWDNPVMQIFGFFIPLSLSHTHTLSLSLFLSLWADVKKIVIVLGGCALIDYVLSAPI